jgi:aminobenzoyl-glutamate utilization protein A
MEIELRGGAAEALEHMEARARSVIEGAALAQGCELRIEEMGRTIGAQSSEGAMRLVREAAQSLPEFDEVLDSWPLGGGDDAAYFMRRVQERGGEAAYLILGSDLAAGHHATTFDFEEADIGRGVRLLQTALELAAPCPPRDG